MELIKERFDMSSEEDMNEASNKFQEGVQQFQEGVEQMKKSAAQMSGRANETFHIGMKEFKNRATVYQGDATEFLDSMAVYIKENPQRSALVAGAAGLGLGLILGLMTRGRRD